MTSPYDVLLNDGVNALLLEDPMFIFQEHHGVYALLYYGLLIFPSGEIREQRVFFGDVPPSLTEEQRVDAFNKGLAKMLPRMLRKMKILDDLHLTPQNIVQKPNHMTTAFSKEGK